MVYILAPLAIMLAAGLLALDFKIGFWVSDKTDATGFGLGFYMMTVSGLLAAEISTALFAIQRWIV